jgi:primosomal protein N' (replication factor Y)
MLITENIETLNRYRVKKILTTCPHCFSRRIKFLGIGTQKLEDETAHGFPTARLLRWDSDVTRAKHSHQEIMDKLKSHQADILIGTQMVAKGLDLPQVTLVGVVSADTALNLPDFRAGERTFQLLSQVAGRAGRGERPGRVIIQTYSPEHYAIQAVLKQDYEAFYKQEIAFRRELNEPPF